MPEPIANPVVSTSDKILQAALAVFLEVGFDKANLEKIAALAGVTKPTVYSHFGSKVGLLQAVARQQAQQALTQFSPNLRSTGNVRRDLSGFAKSFLTNMLHPDAIRIHRFAIVEAMTHPELVVPLLSAGPQTWIALLRGINVGGRNKMPMAILAETLESVGCHSVRTYIQSGNVVFTSSSKSKTSLTKKLREATEAQFGFRPNILLLTEEEFRAAVASNPFTAATLEPKTLHFFFLESRPESPDIDGLATLAIEAERFQLVDTFFYLHAPDGFGRSKLAAGAEKKLGVPATARNYSTIVHLLDMLDAA